MKKWNKTGLSVKVVAPHHRRPDDLKPVKRLGTNLKTKYGTFTSLLNAKNIIGSTLLSGSSATSYLLLTPIGPDQTIPQSSDYLKFDLLKRFCLLVCHNQML